jgi:hypothetical protein
VGSFVVPADSSENCWLPDRQHGLHYPSERYRPLVLPLWVGSWSVPLSGRDAFFLRDISPQKISLDQDDCSSQRQYLCPHPLSSPSAWR